MTSLFGGESPKRAEEVALMKGYHVDKHGNVFNRAGRRLRPYTNPNGYFQFTVKDKGISKKCSVHRLQGLVKFGSDQMFRMGMQIRHLNNNNKDNSWDNIGIGTQSENSMDRPQERRIQMSSHPILDHAAIIAFYSSTRSYKKTMAKFGLKGKSTLNFIVRHSLEALRRIKPYATRNLHQDTLTAVAGQIISEVEALKTDHNQATK